MSKIELTAIDSLGIELNKLFTEISPELWEKIEVVFQEYKEVEKKQHSNTWNAAIFNYLKCEENLGMSWDLFNTYYNETFKSE
jgi:hypothetical protein